MLEHPQQPPRYGPANFVSLSKNFEVFFNISAHLMQTPEARANIFRILFEEAYYVIIIFQILGGGCKCTPLHPLPAPMLNSISHLRFFQRGYAIDAKTALIATAYVSYRLQILPNTLF